MIQIAVINATTKVSDSEAAMVTSHIQTQVTSHFAPIWGINATLTFYGKGSVPPTTSWTVTLLDNSDQAGALGYHDLGPTGAPTGKVFVETAVQNGVAWSLTMSHEVTELLVDPYCNYTAFTQLTNNTGVIQALEVADPVEDMQFGYAIGSVLVSDFVTPLWFDNSAPAGSLFDYKGHCTSAGQILSGGYLGVFSYGGSGWGMNTADASLTLPEGTRRYRRLNKANWKVSTAHANGEPVV